MPISIIKTISISLLILSTIPACSFIDKRFNEYENITRVGSITFPEQFANSIIKKKDNDQLYIDISGQNFRTLYNGSIACSNGQTEVINVITKLNCSNSRNRIIGQWVHVSDRACAFHLGAILGRANTTNVFLGLASITTSGLATFLGGEATRQALAAASTISSGANTLIKSEIYLGNLTPLLTKKIEDNRTLIGNNINSKLNKDTTEYPVDQAIADLSKYHEACSFRKGVQLIAQALENNGPTKDEIDQQIDQLKKRKKDLVKESNTYPKPKENETMKLEVYNTLLTNAKNELIYIDKRTQELMNSRIRARRNSQ